MSYQIDITGTFLFCQTFRLRYRLNQIFDKQLMHAIILFLQHQGMTVSRYIRSLYNCQIHSNIPSHAVWIHNSFNHIQPHLINKIISKQRHTVWNITIGLKLIYFQKIYITNNFFVIIHFA